MKTIANLMRKFEALDTDQLSREAITNTAVDLADQNRAQLHHGYNKDGVLIGDLTPYAWADYAFEKYGRNPLPGLGNPDLEDTGAFYAGIQVTVQRDLIKERSTDEKNDDLTRRYQDIFGLGGDYKLVYVRENLRPSFKVLVEAATGLKMN